MRLYGDSFFRRGVGNRLMRKIAVENASIQNILGRLAWANKDNPISIIWRCFLFTTPFCWKVYGQLRRCRIPFEFKKERNCCEVYSSPLSNWNCFILHEKRFSTNNLNFKTRKHIRFIWNKIHPCKSQIVINKNNIVPTTT